MKHLIDAILSRNNLQKAFERVRENQGCAGIDGISINMFQQRSDEHLEHLRQSIIKGTYTPGGLLLSEIKNARGSSRILAIPTVLDRVLQTAICQCLQTSIEPKFSDSSFGYRPGKSYITAVNRVVELSRQGYTIIVDADIEKFFDNIPQDALIHQIITEFGESIGTLIKHTLFAQQKQKDGSLSFGTKLGVGIPQGSPLSPLLSNYYLHSLDEMLMAAEFQFVRYADDFVVQCKEPHEAQHILSTVNQKLAELGLKLNSDKTQVTDIEHGINFLGHFIHEGGALALSDKATQKVPDVSRSVRFKVNDPVYLDIPLDEFTPSDPEPEQLINAFSDEVAEEIDIVQNAKLQTLYANKQGSVIGMKGNRFEVRLGGDILKSIPASHVDLVLVYGQIQLSTRFKTYCLQHRIPIALHTWSGTFMGVVCQELLQNPKMTIAQVMHQQCNNNRLTIAKVLIRAKLQNTIVLAQRYAKRADPSQQHGIASQIQQLQHARDSVKRALDLQTIRGHEGIAAKTWYALIRTILGDIWQFPSRNRQPPQDPINAMLSYGYSMLFHNVKALLNCRGLHSHLGYLHENRAGQPSLACDLIEPFRPLVVDYILLAITKMGGITPNDFEKVPNKGTQMIQSARRKFIELFETRMQSSITNYGLDIKTDIRRHIDLLCLEVKKACFDNQLQIHPLVVK